MCQAPQKELTLFDSTCLTVGIIIGAGLYQMAPDIARGAGYPWPTLIFCAVCAFLIYCAVTYRPLIAASSLILLLAGYPVYRLTRRNSQPSFKRG